MSSSGLPTSRVVALALLVFLSVAAYRLIVGPLLTAYADVASRIEHSQALLGRYRALSAQRAQLSARLHAVKDALANKVAYLTGPSDTLAGAELQNQVRSIVEDASGKLRSSQILSVASNGAKISPRHVALKIKVLVEMERLQDVLYGLETAQPWMFVHEMTILRRDSQGGGSKKNPMLEVTLEVYGLLARVRQGQGHVGGGASARGLRFKDSVSGTTGGGAESVGTKTTRRLRYRLDCYEV